MSPSDTRPWTDDTERLVIAAVRRAMAKCGSANHQGAGVGACCQASAGRTVLAALHEAGRLMPPGAFLAYKIDEETEDDGISW